MPFPSNDAVMRALFATVPKRGSHDVPFEFNPPLARPPVIGYDSKNNPITPLPKQSDQLGYLSDLAEQSAKADRGIQNYPGQLPGMQPTIPGNDITQELIRRLFSNTAVGKQI